jgi:hypothetical protein
VAEGNYTHPPQLSLPSYHLLDHTRDRAGWYVVRVQFIHEISLVIREHW